MMMDVEFLEASVKNVVQWQHKAETCKIFQEGTSFVQGFYLFIFLVENLGHRVAGLRVEIRSTPSENAASSTNSDLRKCSATKQYCGASRTRPSLSFSERQSLEPSIIHQRAWRTLLSFRSLFIKRPTPETNS